MKRKELLKKLNINPKRFKFVLKKASKIRPSSRKHHEYSQQEVQLLKEYFDAAKKLDEAKVNLGWIVRHGKCDYVPKQIAIRNNQLFSARKFT